MLTQSHWADFAPASCVSRSWLSLSSSSLGSRRSRRPLQRESRIELQATGFVGRSGITRLVSLWGRASALQTSAAEVGHYMV